MQAGIRLIFLSLIWFFGAAPVAGQPAEPAKIAPLIDRLESWLDSHSDLPRAAIGAKIRFADAADFAQPGQRSAAIGRHLRGAYEPETSTISLIRPWQENRVQDQSVLLHELVHHRQTGVHYYCPAAQELAAYKLQRAWLATKGEQLDVNWVAVVLASSCAARDVHPD